MMLKTSGILFLFIIIAVMVKISLTWKYELSSLRRTELKEKCPKVKAIRNFNLNAMLGFWYVVQYYASSEELPEYACMRSLFTISEEDHHITMNFTYIYAEDPLRELLQGNITWYIPNFDIPAHWIHAEDTYEGIYNTYVIDTDYNSWALLMHCAEKSKTPRYLSALLLSRDPILSNNVINFLREKLPRYDIDLSFMFSINQEDCDNLNLRNSSASSSSSSVNDMTSYSLFNGGESKNKKNPIKIIPKTF